MHGSQHSIFTCHCRCCEERLDQASSHVGNSARRMVPPRRSVDLQLSCVGQALSSISPVLRMKFTQDQIQVLEHLCHVKAQQE